MLKVYLFGYSGHAYVLLESMITSGLKPIGYFDFEKARNNPYRLTYLGYEKEVNLKSVTSKGLVFPAIGDNSVRKRIIKLIETQALHTQALIDTTAIVSTNTTIAHCTYIGKNVCINSLTEVGKGVIVNTASVVEHECQLGDYCHIAPNATLCGNVKIGSGVFFGAGAVAKEGIQIGENSVIGAASVVLKDIPPNEIWAGNPAKRIKHVG